MAVKNAAPEIGKSVSAAIYVHEVYADVVDHVLYLGLAKDDILR